MHRPWLKLSVKFMKFTVLEQSKMQLPLLSWAKSRNLHVVLLLVGIFVVGFMLGSQSALSAAQGGDTTPPTEAEEAFEAFWQVYNLIQNNYLDDVETSALVDGAIHGMINALGDQYSGYMDPETYPLLDSDLSGEYEGIGVMIETIEETGEIKVISVFDGSPAQEAGVMPGDIFVEVNGVNVVGLNQLELSGLVRGPAGTEVNIVFRRGEESLPLTIKRAAITTPNLTSTLFEGGIAHITLNQFTANARLEIDNALNDLRAQGDVNAIILDLRGNPGGLLSSAIDVGSAFLADGVILIEDFGDGNERVFEASGSYLDIDTPLIVLVDETSASASELVAGAWQDRNRAVIIGEVTLGKGTVQTWQPLVNGGGVRLTIARWLTPNRNWIHEQGVTPDIIVEWTPEDPADFYTENDPQLNVALEFAESLVAEE